MNTPETDAQTCEWHHVLECMQPSIHGDWVAADFARKIERERDQARTAARKLRDAFTQGEQLPWENATVDLPDTAAQDSASKSNNPAISG